MSERAGQAQHERPRLDRGLATVVVLAGAIVIAAGTLLLFAGGPPPPPPRPLPPAPGDPSAALKLSATVYRATLEQDARRFGAPPTTPEEMSKPFPYFDEGGDPRPLKVGPSAAIETPHLRIALLVKKEAGSMEGQTFRADHLVLRIENRTRHHLAYRVETRVSDERRCGTKGELAQNAIALAPSEAVERTECLWRKDEKVEVRRVEVMELPELAADYASRLPPALVLYGPRTSGGHLPPKGAALCPQTFSWREIRDGADRGELGWRDVIDFYARHNCDEYVFFPTYRHRTDASEPLPAHPKE